LIIFLACEKIYVFLIISEVRNYWKIRFVNFSDRFAALLTTISSDGKFDIRQFFVPFQAQLLSFPMSFNLRQQLTRVMNKSLMDLFLGHLPSLQAQISFPFEWK
jgi:hypothetical protein